MKKALLLLSLMCLFTFPFAQNEAMVAIYDDGFEGALTASGEIFEQDKFTAAHETLPLGTEVEILNVLNGKKVTVTINDRLHQAPDLFWISKAAAWELDIISNIPTQVLYAVPGDVPAAEPTDLYKKLFLSLGNDLGAAEKPGISSSSEKAPLAYGVQVFACEKRMDAVTLSRRIQQELDYISYFEKYVTDSDTLYRVVIGDFQTEKEALDCYWKLKSDIPDVFIIEIR